MSRRDINRERTLIEIKQIAHQQMAEKGTAAVSLSAIARQMEMSTPALYRYYASRDDLITALIADAYNDLANELEKADGSFPVEEYAQRLWRVLMSYREWALAHPIDFRLIYGNPIPGYHAPEDTTTPPARRGFAVILGILAGALDAGALKPQPEHLQLPEGLLVGLPVMAGQASVHLQPVIVYIGIQGWTRIHGMLMLELFGHVQTLVSDTGKLYQHEISHLLDSIGLNHPNNS